MLSQAYSELLLLLALSPGGCMMSHLAQPAGYFCQTQHRIHIKDLSYSWAHDSTFG